MPYAPHTRLIFSGYFGLSTAPVEEWSFSFATAPVTSGQPGAYVALATEGLVAYNANLKGLFGPKVVLARVRAQAMNETGHVPQTADGQYLQGDNTTGSVGTATQTTNYPLQTALAVSLVTPRAGATGKGRFFLPWPAKTLDSTYALVPVDAQDVATKVGAFLSAVANSSAFVGGIEVASSKGYSSPVNGVRVGTVPDTMRSRRGRMVELYSPAVVTGYPAPPAHDRQAPTDEPQGHPSRGARPWGSPVSPEQPQEGVEGR